MALNKQYKVFLIDTSTDKQLAGFLQDHGYEVIALNSGQEVLNSLNQGDVPNAVIMDLVMPDLDGIETCIEIRNLPHLKKTFIIFYTDRAEEYSQIAAFKAGADDYIVRPAANKVIHTRLNALFRRLENPVKGLSVANTQLPFNLAIDRERYMVRQDNKEIQLPRKEFELLALLCSSPRKVFSRQEISSSIWGFEMEPKNRTIDVHIRKLREKLGLDLIKTVKGIGYKIEI